MKSPLLYIIHFTFHFLLFFYLYGTNPEKMVRATRSVEQIKIDGNLSEPIWQNAEKATDFIQSEPLPGKAATFETETFFVYDNNAIYIGAKMHDPEPDKILKELSLRDQMGNADNFKLFFDTYKSGLNGFKFCVTASGVQYEAIVSNNSEDVNWNAVWESAVKIHPNGWSVEIRIPYSSLRFPTSDIQEWNVQFGREIRRLRESSSWSFIDPLINGWVQQSGVVTNIEKVKSPVRLSLTPYISGYLNTSFDPNATDQKITSATAYSAGLDLKYGLNDAFTLDMTLIPDFGQVISDKQILNLSPFEVFFTENRQFFTEGTELFNKGNLFYSRRIGGSPFHYSDINNQIEPGEYITSNPDNSQLFNATKITGRTPGGTGIGAFNAFVGEEFATVRSENGDSRTIKTNPHTNYNAFVIDQNLKNNSFISLINTNVLRSGIDYDANVTGTFFNFKTKDQQFSISGNGVLSQKYFHDITDLGYTYNVALGKISGNWKYKAGHGVESQNYDPNDLGFLYSPNEKYISASGGYTQYKPKNEKLQQYNISGNAIYSRLYRPDVFTNFGINFENFILWKSRFAIGLNASLEPIRTFDYFEPRTLDFSKALMWPENYIVGGFISSDYRKPFACDVNFSYRGFNIDKRKTISTGIRPRIRFNDKFSVFPTTNILAIIEEPGYVDKMLTGKPIVGVSDDDILMGVRDRLIIENSITAKFTFNSVMNINMRIRHYWDKVSYQSFGLLTTEGNVDKINFNGQNDAGDKIFDRNVNIFNIDMQYNWRFAPGSDIVIVWKNQIYHNDKKYDRNYFSNLGGLFDAVQENSFSIRVLYFLDYLYLFPRKES
ncbi:MAG: carbohydrate binding family 9 domain-containing protein [Saprospiraceae bacterium]|nr:carbohydrate binding family 9 domain-containing protein [Saprospiraceae bacterium]